MTPLAATAEVFLTAFRALPAPERLTILEELFAEEEGKEVFDTILAGIRESEASLSFEEYLASREERARERRT